MKQEVYMKDIIQRFGAAMFVPVLLFPAAGMLLGFSVVLLNQEVFPWALEGSAWVKVSTIILQASLAVFKNMALIWRGYLLFQNLKFSTLTVSLIVSSPSFRIRLFLQNFNIY